MSYIMSDHEPYDDISEEEVTARYWQGEFPDVDAFVCGQAIKGCWTGFFGTAQDIVQVIWEEDFVENSERKGRMSKLWNADYRNYRAYGVICE